jgi:hypothetical protein
MITVKLKGGLGNQMFQYALGRALSLKHKVPLGLDISTYEIKDPRVARYYALDVFNITGNALSKIPLRYKLHNFFSYPGKEKYFNFDPAILQLSDGAYLNGYWQSPKYFEGFKDIIKKDFTLKNFPASNIQTLAEEIKSQNSLCVHVRRGDYVGNKFHEVVDNEYYRKGLDRISTMTTIEKIYVFSDDINWCKENISFEIPTFFVEDEYSGEKGEGHMYLMSKCKNFIIANSSFSWWGAWLATYENKIVICPKQWFGDASIDTSDLIPKEWIRI